jgi:hypothetical protein
MKMTDDSKIKALNYLETVQRECLQYRFGDNYESGFENMLAIQEEHFDIEEYIISQPSMTEIEKEEFRSAYAQHVQSIKPPTKFQDIQSYSILQTLFSKIEETAKRKSLITETRPTIGTAHSKEYNAFAERVPETNEFIIVFESELFTLANLLAKLVSLSLPDFNVSTESVFFNASQERIVNHVQTNKALQNRFADLVYNAIFLGQPNLTQQYYLQEPLGRMQYELLNSLELFVVGHEYGHIYCGHLKETNIIRGIIRNKPVDRISPDWEMEYEADMVGLDLLINSLDNTCFPPFSFMGPELFFTFLDLDERAFSLFSNGEEKRSMGSDTHPPTFERRKRIRQALKSSLPQNHLESYEFVSQFLENIFESLWGNFKIEH